MDSRALAKQIRLDSLDMIYGAQTSHIGSCLSVADILAILYASVIKPSDKVIFSKGHAAAAFYSVLARTGHFDPEVLKTYCKPGSDLYGSISCKVPGVLVSTGSLGHGFPIACGMALANSEHKVYCVMSDGEMDCGTTWEAALFSIQNNLSNLTVLVDENGWQACKKISNYDPFPSDGSWDIEYMESTEHEEMISFLCDETDRPSILFVRTLKGKGVSFMENDNAWHYRHLTENEYIKAKREIECAQPL